jgi:short-subunit dehydrogenase
MTQTALITGASGGIGKELAVLFAKDGHDLVLVARSGDKLQRLAEDLTTRYGVSVKIMVKDLEDPEAAQQMVEELQRESITVDYLINNAGFGLYGEFLTTDLDKEAGMIDLNIKTLTILTKRFLPQMVERGQGGVLNVASTAAFQPGPLMAVYFATKAYVLSFTEALENECKGTGVKISALCPGPTQTGFGEAANMNASKLFQSGAMDVQEVAQIGYNGFLKGKPIVIPGMQNRLLAFLVRFLPRETVKGLVRQMQGPK